MMLPENTERILVRDRTANHSEKGLVRAMLHNTKVLVEETTSLQGGFTTWLRISGTIAQLEAAIAHSCVVEWQLDAPGSGQLVWTGQTRKPGSHRS